MSENKSENKLNDIIQTSLENIKNMVDVNTIIGEPIHTDSGTVIIPVSKVSIGFASGGLDYIGKNSATADKPNNFGGGGGTGISVAPIAFLVIHVDGTVDMLTIDNPTGAGMDLGSSIANLLEKSPTIIQKIKDVFSKKKSDTDETAETETDSE